MKAQLTKWYGANDPRVLMLTTPASDPPSLPEKVEPKSEAGEAGHKATVEQEESAERERKAEAKRKLLQPRWSRDAELALKSAPPKARPPHVEEEHAPGSCNEGAASDVPIRKVTLVEAPWASGRLDSPRDTPGSSSHVRSIDEVPTRQVFAGHPTPPGRGVPPPMHATAFKSGSRAGYAPRVVPRKPLSKMQKQRQNQASDVQLWNKCRSTVTHRVNWETNESKRNGLAAMGGCHYCPGLAIVDPWRPSSAQDRPENHGLTMRLNRCPLYTSPSPPHS